MKHIKLFEAHQSSHLMIVDVQKSFKEYFSIQYVEALKTYSKSFNSVYQIWDNHIDGKNVDLDYLYDDEPDIPIHSDLYRFPNEVELIEKRYNYDVNIDFYKSVLSTDDYTRISEMEDRKKIQIGEMVKTTKGTLLVYVGNNHVWYHCPKKLYDILIEIKTAQTNGSSSLVIVGGSDSECLEDVFVCAESLGIKIVRDYKYIYTATNCPI